MKCPVCDAQFKKFLPYGRKSRSNALCPNCLALERHRLLWLYLKEKTDFFSTRRKMLHIAPEHCFIKRFEAMQNLEYITADIESPLAKVKMDIHEIPFEENAFDVIFCNHVLEHVDDDIKALGEIKRVLKPGGWAILQVPFYEPIPETTFEDPSIKHPKEREKAFGQDDHVRMYGKDYPERIRSTGLIVEEIELAKNLPAEMIAQHAVLEDEILFKAIKSTPN